MPIIEAREVSLEINLYIHGLVVAVIVGDAEAVETRGIWLTNVTESIPSSTDFARRQPSRVMALSRYEVPTIPIGSIVVAPEYYGADSRAWRVDGLVSKEAQHSRVYLIPVPVE